MSGRRGGGPNLQVSSLTRWQSNHVTHVVATAPKKPCKELSVAHQLLAPARPAGGCSQQGHSRGAMACSAPISFSVRSPELANPSPTRFVVLRRIARCRPVRVTLLIACPGDAAAPQGGFAGSSCCTALILVHLSPPAAGFISPSDTGDPHGQEISFKI